MKHLGLLILLLLIFSCESTYRITQVRYDQSRRLYVARVEDSRSEVYLRDDNFNLIRNEADKMKFISNYNAYWSLDEKVRTNEYYNDYYWKTADFEVNNSRDLYKNYECSSLYFSGVRNIKSSNYVEALSNFNKLVSLYSEVRYYSDILFLEGYCFEKMGDKDQAYSNYNLFVNQSVQRYSKLFNEDAEDTNAYLQELRYSYQVLSNVASPLDEKTMLSNDVAKYYNNLYSPGFNYTQPAGSTEWLFGFGFDTYYGFNVGTGVRIGLTRNISICPSIIYSAYQIGSSLKVPVQIYRSEDRRFGFEVTPAAYYSYFYQAQLSDDTNGNLYSISQNVLNFGIESSAGCYILPSLQAGLSVAYMYYNQYNKYRVYENVNGKQYYFDYWSDLYYYLSLRYYFVKNLSIEAALKNNDFLLGLVAGGLYIGYNINKNMILLNYCYLY